MVPLSVAWPVGLPVGLWALSVLRSPAVQASVGRLPPEPLVRSWPGKATIAAVVCLFVGGLTTFLPWSAISFFGVATTAYGFDMWNGLVAGGCCILGLLVLVSMELLHPARGWRVATPLVAGLVVIGVTATFFVELSRGLTITNKEVRGDPGLEGLAEMFMQQTLSSVRVRPHIGPFVALAVGLGLMGLGLWALRSSRRPHLEGGPRPTYSATGNPAAGTESL
jgi:hypothetical protein